MTLSKNGINEAGQRRNRFESLYEEHFDALLAYALRRTERETAYDAVEEAFLVAWRRLDDVPEDALPWLIAVTRRVLANQRRSTRRRRLLFRKLTHNRVEASSAEPPLEHSNLNEALRHLSGREREALMLTAWEGLDGNRAAAALGITPVAYRVRLHRAKRRLARELERAETPLPTSTAKELP